MSLVSVLISTANDRISKIPKFRSDNINCIIVHQIYEPIEVQGREIPNDFKYKKLEFPGLSKSRNVAIDLCDTAYAYIMDDDVKFYPEKIQDVVALMERDAVDVATCQFCYETRGLPARYKKESYDHDLISAAKVASIEICVNVESIRSKRIRFDERFGLGSELPSGEEYIFLADCIKNGLRVRYYPILIGQHPDFVSGADFYTDFKKIMAKREMIKRVWGWKSPFLIFAFWMKKMPLVLRRGHALSFTKTIFFGR